jgi:hypothetical protein
VSVAEIAWAKDASLVLAIRGSSFDVESSSHVSSSLGKRGSDLISASESSSQEQPFLSSYGSAFLSGIFADIAETQTGEDESSDAEDTVMSEPVPKKSRPVNWTAFGVQATSFTALDKLIGGGEMSISPATLSPRAAAVSPKTNQPPIKIELFNHQVRELQNLAFPSLPGIPVTVSSSSCTIAPTGAVVTPRDSDSEQEQESFGWFVSTDDDDANAEEASPASMFLPLAKSTLAFRASATAPKDEESADVEVQQALAADTIDDVLGDLF